MEQKRFLKNTYARNFTFILLLNTLKGEFCFQFADVKIKNHKGEVTYQEHMPIIEL